MSKLESVVVNLCYQLVWIDRHLQNRSSTLLGMSVRVLLETTGVWVSKLSREGSSWMWALMEWKAGKREAQLLILSSSRAGTLFAATVAYGHPDPRFFSLWTWAHTSSSLGGLSRLQSWTGAASFVSMFWGFQLLELSKLLGSLPFQNTYTLGSVPLERAD
jgi:hypothetical protein